LLKSKLFILSLYHSKPQAHCNKLKVVIKFFLQDAAVSHINQ